MKIDLTPLTSHPDWASMAALFAGLEAQLVNLLKTEENVEANRDLVALSRVKAEISQRSRTPNLWKVLPHE